MKIYRDLKDIGKDYPTARFGLTLGNFDGLHLGHQSLINSLIQKSKEDNLISIVLSFYPHPKEIFNPQINSHYLCSPSQKENLFSRIGIDIFCEMEFTKKFSGLTAEEFCKSYLFGPLNIDSLVLGYDFKFGSDKENSKTFIENYCKENNIKLLIQGPFEKDEQVVSSTLIRDLLKRGEIESANSLLGRKFSLQGIICEGHKRGRQIEIPTANQLINNKMVIPKEGVYCTEVFIDEKKHLSVTNIGRNPTFGDGNETSIETHILGFDGDLYGKTLEVYFLSKIRDEKKFSSVEELKEQINKDIEVVKKRSAT